MFSQDLEIASLKSQLRSWMDVPLIWIALNQVVLRSISPERSDSAASYPLHVFGSDFIKLYVKSP